MEIIAPVGPADKFFLDLDRNATLISTIGALFILDEEPAEDLVLGTLEFLAEALPPFRYRVEVTRWGEHLWVKHETDVAAHMSTVDLPPGSGLQDALMVASEIYSKPFDRTKPLWQAAYIRGLDGGGSCLLLKINHALGDGVGFIRVLEDGQTHGEAPADNARSFNSGFPSYARRRLTRLADDTRWAARLALRWAVDRRLRASVNRQLRSNARYLAGVIKGGHRRIGAPSERRVLAAALALPLTTWQNAAKSRDGGVNELFLDVAATTVLRIFKELGKPLDSIRAVMPVAMRDLDNADLTNKAARGLVDLPTSMLGCANNLAPLGELLRSARTVEALPVSPTVERLQGLLIPAPIRRQLIERSFTYPDLVASNLRLPLPELEIGAVPARCFYNFAPPTGIPASFVLGNLRDQVQLTMALDPGLIGDVNTARQLFHQTVEQATRFAALSG